MTTSTSGKVAATNTGDTQNTVIWEVLAGLSAAVIAGAEVIRRKMRRDDDR